MTVSGLLTGWINPHGNGFALIRTAPMESPIKRTGNHDFGERAADPAALAIANALEQFAKPKGRQGAPGRLKPVIDTPSTALAAERAQALVARKRAQRTPRFACCASSAS